MDGFHIIDIAERDEISPLDTPVQYIASVGPARAAMLERLELRKRGRETRRTEYGFSGHRSLADIAIGKWRPLSLQFPPRTLADCGSKRYLSGSFLSPTRTVPT